MIIFLYGEDSFRSRLKLKELKEKFIRDVDPAGHSLTILDEDKLSMEKINQAIGSISLLSKKRMIIIEGVFSKKEELAGQLSEYFKNRQEAQDDNILIFRDEIKKTEKLGKIKSQLFNFLSKQKYAQEFKAFSNIEMLNWLKKEVDARGGQITAEAASLLIALTGGDMWQLDQEIEKLVNYKKSAARDEKTKIGTAEVKELVAGVFDDKIFALTDAISSKNKPLALKLFEEQSEFGKSDDFLLNMITRQVKILLQVRQALDSGVGIRDVSAVLKIHPFVAQKCISQVRNFNLPGLKKLLDELVRVDYLMKSGKADIKISLSLLLAKL